MAFYLNQSHAFVDGNKRTAMTIRGLENFTQHFSKYKEDYAIVGGIASANLLENVGINFRATKDICTLAQGPFLLSESNRVVP